MTEKTSRCPHVGALHSLIQALEKRKARQCELCSTNAPNLWVCMNSDCLFVGCNEGSYDHSAVHAETKDHPLLMNLTTKRIWCNECEKEVFTKNFPPFPDGPRPERMSSTSTNLHNRSRTFHARGSDRNSSSEEESEIARFAGHPGLCNLGNTCYMNAALQSLSNCPPLTHFFLDSQELLLNREKKPVLARNYQDFLKDMLVDKAHVRSLNPRSLLGAFRNVYSMFRGYSQQDPQEFLRCFMDRLHEELKQPVVTSDIDDDQSESEESEEEEPSDDSPSNDGDGISNGEEGLSNGESLSIHKSCKGDNVIHERLSSDISQSQSTIPTIDQSEDEYETCDSGRSSERSSMQNSMTSGSDDGHSSISAEDPTLIADPNSSDGTMAMETTSTPTNDDPSPTADFNNSPTNSSQISSAQKLPSLDSGIQCMASSSESVESPQSECSGKDMKEAINLSLVSTHQRNTSVLSDSILYYAHDQDKDLDLSGSAPLAQVHTSSSRNGSKPASPSGSVNGQSTSEGGGNSVSETTSSATTNKIQKAKTKNKKGTASPQTLSPTSSTPIKRNRAHSGPIEQLMDREHESVARVTNQDLSLTSANHNSMTQSSPSVSDNTRFKSKSRGRNQNMTSTNSEPVLNPNQNVAIQTRSRSSDSDSHVTNLNVSRSPEGRRTVSESSHGGSTDARGHGHVKQKSKSRQSSETERLLKNRSTKRRHVTRETVKKKIPAYHSVISDVFEGRILSQVECLTCKTISSTKETFQDLSLPIPSRDHMRVLATQQQRGSCGETAVQSSWVGSMFGWMKSWFWGPAITLQNCLAAFFSTDELKGDNMYSCEKCKKLRNGTKSARVLKLPEVLCIHLKRFRHEFMYSSKVNTFVSFPLDSLDMRPYLHAECADKVTSYDLVAIVCHHGSSLANGHYTGYGKDERNGHWYEYDDERVDEVHPMQVENAEAYVLFYRKRNDQMLSLRKKAGDIHRTGNSGMMRFWVSRQWITKFNTFAEPGPISNHDFICPHGGVSPKKWNCVHHLAVEVSQSQWQYWHKKFGGGPAITHLQQCSTCLEKQEALKQRKIEENETFSELHEEFRKSAYRGAVYALSMHWFNQWQNFISDKTDEPPGPVDNSRICTMKQGTPLIRKNSDYGEVSEQTWQFFVDRYGGGPEIQTRTPVNH